MWIRLALLAALVCLAHPTPLASQQTATLEHIIRRNIDQGMFDGHDTKVIGGIGDPAAVVITKVLAGRDLTTQQIDIALLVLNQAFGSIEYGPDAEPRTALFVLRALDLSTNDPQLRGRIAQTRKYIQDEFSKSTQPTLPPSLTDKPPL